MIGDLEITIKDLLDYKVLVGICHLKGGMVLCSCEVLRTG